jgi:hypothetical protein
MAQDEAKNPVKGVSGPGKFSSRTDLPPSTSYGEGVQTAAIAGGAPMASASDVRGATNTELRAAGRQGQSAMGMQQTPLTPLFAPSQRPDEPITAGVDMGLGPGSDALMMNQIDQNDKDIVAKYLPSLTSMAAQQDTPKSFRAFVSFLQGSL